MDAGPPFVAHAQASVLVQQGMELLVSDAHQGIRKAAARHMQNVGWQRCRVRFLLEMLAKVSWRDRPALAWADSH